MDLSYRRYKSRVLVTGLETIVFGILLGLWHIPIPIIRTDVFSESFKHLADIPEISSIIIVGLLAVFVSLFTRTFEYKLQLVSLVLMQLVWSYSMVGFALAFYDNLHSYHMGHVAPWVLFLSIAVFVRNCDNIYTLKVLDKTRKEQLNQLVELRCIESKIEVTRQTTMQQLAKIKEARNSKEGKAYNNSGNKNT